MSYCDHRFDYHSLIFGCGIVATAPGVSRLRILGSIEDLRQTSSSPTRLDTLADSDNHHPVNHSTFNF